MANNGRYKKKQDAPSNNTQSPSRPPRNIVAQIPNPLPVQIQPSTEDNHRDAKEQDYRDKSLRIAEQLNGITKFGGVVGLLGLMAIFLTILQSRYTFQTGQRAWVGADVDIEDSPIRLGQNIHEKDTWRIRIKNTGQSPALNLRFTGGWVATKGSPDWNKIQSIMDTAEIEKDTESILLSSQSTGYAGTGDYIEDQSIRDGVLGDHTTIAVYGRIQYSDIFMHSHSSTFCLKYAPFKVDSNGNVIPAQSWKECPVVKRAN